MPDAHVHAASPSASPAAPGQLPAVRARARHAVQRVADAVRPGMSEEQARDLAKSVVAELGFRRGWHHVVVRFGRNTACKFMELSEPGVTLGQDDIFFLDIGPVLGDEEGHAGATFALGDNPLHHQAARDVKTLWDGVCHQWALTSGQPGELHAYAAALAQRKGWELNVDDLQGARTSPAVLGLGIVAPDRSFGAYYEDFLLEDQTLPDWAVSARRVIFTD